MFSTWWWVWLAFMFLFLLTPTSYGWRYRGWGPPIPSYVQRQRVERGAIFTGRAPHHHQTWGRGGDLVWTGMIILLFWMGMGIMWSR